MFIAKQNDLLIQVGDSLEELQEKIKDISNTEIFETNIEYKMYNGKVLTPEEIAKEEEEKINHLTMTALDLILYFRKMGISTEEIISYLNTNPEVYLQLTLCQNVYCGVVRQLAPIKVNEELTITDEQIIQIFKHKNSNL